MIMDFKQGIAELLHGLCGLSVTEAHALLESPPDPKLGDYAFPCFTLAKTLKKAPTQIASDLARDAHQHLQEHHLTSCIATGPYLNFFIDKETLAKHVIETIIRLNDSYGKPAPKNGTIMVEYCQVNTHKAFHVGHLRGTLLGDTLVRLLKAQGHQVLGVNYQGDIGSHVAKVMWYLTKHNTEADPAKHKGRWVGRMYQKANTLLKTENVALQEQYKKEVSQTLQQLESNDPDLMIRWKQTREWCLDDFNAFYTEINVHFDRFFFESEMEKPGKALVQKMLIDKIAILDNGAVIIDLEKEKLGKFLLLKSDGTALYATKDLALATIKYQEYGITTSIHVVGSEQKLYFEQLFATLQRMGFAQAKNCIHVPYELVNLEGGKISSREGDLIYAEELVDNLNTAALQGVEERHTQWPIELKQRTARAIALAALRFSFLHQDNAKPIIFNPQKALDFEGETGPYIQYAIVRINSIEEKAQTSIGINQSTHIPYDLLVHPKEHALISLLRDYPQILESATNHYKPAMLTHYLFTLAQAFNEFYHACPILQAPPHERIARLHLIKAVKIVLQQGLALLGIETPEKM